MVHRRPPLMVSGGRRSCVVVERATQFARLDHPLLVEGLKIPDHLGNQADQLALLLAPPLRLRLAEPFLPKPLRLLLTPPLRLLLPKPLRLRAPSSVVAKRADAWLSAVLTVLLATILLAIGRLAQR